MKFIIPLLLLSAAACSDGYSLEPKRHAYFTPAPPQHLADRGSWSENAAYYQSLEAGSPLT